MTSLVTVDLITPYNYQL